MRHAVLLVLTLFPLLPCRAMQSAGPEDWKNPTLERMGFKGPVRQFRLERIAASPDGSMDPASRQTLKQCSFDEKGRALECSDYSFEKKIRFTQRLVYRYDALGRTAGVDTYGGFGGPSRVEYTLDEQGRWLERRYVQASGEPGGRWVRKYDARSNLVEEAWYSWNWKLGDPPSGRTIYQYDDLGHLLSIQYLAPNPAISWETRNKLDAEGRIAETETFYAGQPTMRQTWEYDEQGRKISETTVFFKEEFISFHDPKPGRVTWKYDDAAGVVEQTHYDTLGNPVTVIRTASDEQGNRTAADEYQLNNSLATIGNIELNGLKAKVTWSAGSPAVIYEYDEQGNWIRAIHTRKSQFNLDSPRTTDFIEERAIEYYSPRPL